MQRRNRQHWLNKCVCICVLLTFTLGGVVPPAHAQSATVPVGSLQLPAPGTMLAPSEAFIPPIIRGIKVNPEDPFQLDFIVDHGNVELEIEDLKNETTDLIKYFLATLTVPEEDMWVNLSPYESDRIVPNEFGETEMGRDLLAQDYILKQITASLMYPEEDLGKEFWNEVYQQAKEQFGTTDIPMNTFNKVWIVPDEAVVYQKETAAFVLVSNLKVLLEEDYLALNENAESERFDMEAMDQQEREDVNAVSSQIIKQIIIPALEREVNEGKHFAKVRQIYHSVILATWYKKQLKNSILNQVYADQNKIAGVDVDDKEIKQKIYEQYLAAFKKGVYDYIKEEYDPLTQEMIPRKYFSGGSNMDLSDEKPTVVTSGEGHPEATSFLLSRTTNMSTAMALILATCTACDWIKGWSAFGGGDRPTAPILSAPYNAYDQIKTVDQAYEQPIATLQGLSSSLEEQLAEPSGDFADQLALRKDASLIRALLKQYGTTETFNLTKLKRQLKDFQNKELQGYKDLMAALDKVPGIYLVQRSSTGNEQGLIAIPEFGEGVYEGLEGVQQGFPKDQSLYVMVYDSDLSLEENAEQFYMDFARLKQSFPRATQALTGVGYANSIIQKAQLLSQSYGQPDIYADTVRMAIGPYHGGVWDALDPIWSLNGETVPSDSGISADLRPYSPAQTELYSAQALKTYKDNTRYIVSFTTAQHQRENIPLQSVFKNAAGDFARVVNVPTTLLPYTEDVTMFLHTYFLRFAHGEITQAEFEAQAETFIEERGAMFSPVGYRGIQEETQENPRDAVLAEVEDIQSQMEQVLIDALTEAAPENADTDLIIRQHFINLLDRIQRSLFENTLVIANQDLYDLALLTQKAAYQGLTRVEKRIFKAAEEDLSDIKDRLESIDSTLLSIVSFGSDPSRILESALGALDAIKTEVQTVRALHSARTLDVVNLVEIVDEQGGQRLVVKRGQRLLAEFTVIEETIELEKEIARLKAARAFIPESKTEEQILAEVGGDVVAADQRIQELDLERARAEAEYSDTADAAAPTILAAYNELFDRMLAFEADGDHESVVIYGQYILNNAFPHMELIRLGIDGTERTEARRLIQLEAATRADLIEAEIDRATEDIRLLSSSQHLDNFVLGMVSTGIRFRNLLEVHRNFVRPDVVDLIQAQIDHADFFVAEQTLNEIEREVNIILVAIRQDITVETAGVIDLDGLNEELEGYLSSLDRFDESIDFDQELSDNAKSLIKERTAILRVVIQGAIEEITVKLQQKTEVDPPVRKAFQKAGVSGEPGQIILAAHLSARERDNLARLATGVRRPIPAVSLQFAYDADAQAARLTYGSAVDQLRPFVQVFAEITPDNWQGFVSEVNQAAQDLELAHPDNPRYLTYRGEVYSVFDVVAQLRLMAFMAEVNAINQNPSGFDDASKRLVELYEGILAWAQVQIQSEHMNMQPALVVFDQVLQTLGQQDAGLISINIPVFRERIMSNRKNTVSLYELQQDIMLFIARVNELDRRAKNEQQRERAEALITSIDQRVAAVEETIPAATQMIIDELKLRARAFIAEVDQALLSVDQSTIEPGGPQPKDGQPLPAGQGAIQRPQRVKRGTTAASDDDADANTGQEDESWNRGGIDLNPSKIHLRIEGEGQPFEREFNTQELFNLDVEGFYPYIINIQPVTNLPLLLGMNEQEVQEYQQLSRK